MELHVEGRNFYPPLLADIAQASSSVHITQFGFRAGLVGDRFADVLIAKAGEGVPVRLIVDRQGTDPERGSREFYDRLAAAGIVVYVNSGTQFRAPRGALGAGRPMGWNLRGLGHIDHRKAVVVDGRIGWVGGAGIEDHFENGEFHDLFVRVEGPVVSQLQLVFVASLRWLDGEIPTNEIPELFPPLDEGTSPVPAVVLHNAPGRFRPITDAITELHRRGAGNPRRREPLRHRPRHDRADREGSTAGRARAPVRARQPEQLGLRCAEQFHHGRLLDAGVQLLGYPKMLHAKAFIADGEHVLVGTCNLEAWSLKRFFEIDIGFDSTDLAAQFEERFLAPAEEVSSDMQPPVGPEGARASSGVRRDLAAVCNQHDRYDRRFASTRPYGGMDERQAELESRAPRRHRAARQRHSGARAPRDPLIWDQRLHARR